MARYEHSGGARDVKLVGDITGTSTSLTIDSGTGWPTGAGGKFWVAIDPDTASEEHLLVNARTGTSLTLTSSADRGLDDTAQQDHSSGAVVRHIWSAVEADDVALQSADNAFAGDNTFAGDSTFDGPAVFNGAATLGGAAAFNGANTFGGRATFNAIVDVGVSLRPVGTGTLLVQDTGGFSLAELFQRTDVSALSTALKVFWRDDGGAARYDPVTVGAVGSGGAGKRLLVVPN
jgi:hypothetical protein